jgi:sodium transport system permease protein
MRPHIIAIIFRKEVTEFLRDRVTLFAVVGLPLLLYPLGMLLLGPLLEAKITALQAPPPVSTVAVWGTGAEALIHWLAATNKFYKLELGKGLPASLRREMEAGRWEPPVRTNPPPRELPFALEFSTVIPPGAADVDAPLLRAVREVLGHGLADVVLVVWPEFDEAIQRQDRGRVTVYFDSVLPQSATASSRLATELESFRKHLVRERQHERGLPAGFSVALSADTEDAAPLKRQLWNILGRVLPLLIIALTLFGALAAAADITAGEKERGTMQTLLCAPVKPLEIMTGKFLAVWSISLIVALANLSGLGFTILRLSSVAGIQASPFGTLFAIFALLIPAGCVISAVFLAVAALARDAKDASLFLGIALLLLFAPLASAMLPGMELTILTCFIPLGNLALLTRELMMGGATAGLAALTLLASVTYAALALLFAAKVFAREQILLGGPVSWRWLLRGDAHRPATPTPGFVLMVFAVVVAGFFYASLAVLGQSRSAQVLVPELLILLPAVALSVARRFPMAQTFSLRRPHWRSLVGSVLIGLTAGVVVAGITPRFAQMPGWLTHEMLKVLAPGGQPGSLWVLWLLIAFTPALCEETFFRGLMLSGLRRWGPWAAIGISALCFGLLHGSIYRLWPAFALGLVLGFAVWRSGSLYCGMVIHALNNGLAVTLLWWGGAAEIEKVEAAPWSLALGALVVVGIGLALLTWPKPRAGAELPGT